MKKSTLPTRRIAVSALTFALLLCGGAARGADSGIGSHKAFGRARTDWLLTNILSAYRQSGRQDARWDKSVTNALAAFAMLRGTVSAEIDLSYLLRKHTLKAIDSGSDDAMMDYLQAREDDMHAR